MTTFVISVSYGNDSLAMIQWAHEVSLSFFGDVVVTYCDTGWAAPGWDHRVALGEGWARSLGFKTVRLTSIGFEELVTIKDGFPSNQHQFCTGHLKGVPFLQWLDECDVTRQAVVMVGKRRVESLKRADTPEYVNPSEYHGDRCLWHPLYLHTDVERDALLERAGIDVLPEELIGAPFDAHGRLYRLPHRSLECNPCVNANRQDFLRLTGPEIARVSALEVKIGRSMFRPKRFNAMGIYGVVAWAKFGKNHEEGVEDAGCGAPFGCGL